MVKKIKNAIKEWEKGFKLGFSSTHGDIIGYVLYNNKNIPIIYSPAHIALNNGIFANCSIHNGEYRIVVDDYYVQAPKSVQDFINQHELGHLYWLDNGHENGHTLVDEFMADTYGAKQVGTQKAIDALNHIWNVMCNTNNVIYALTFPSRLKELGADVSSMYIIGLNGKTFREEDLREILLKEVK